jgi:prepilin-type N-terminal cleavage/methylation domain-containing protein
MISRPEGSRAQRDGFTLMEVMISMLISAVLIGGLILGYTSTLQRAEWSAYELAAQSLAQQRVEQARAAKWDRLASPPVDQVISDNFPPTVEILDVPIAGTNITWATNFTTISDVTLDPPLKLIQVDCVWSWHDVRLFTNKILTYRAPDQ